MFTIYIYSEYRTLFNFHKENGWMKDNTAEMSLSKQRKLLRKQEIEKKKRDAVILKCSLIGACLLIIGLIGWGIFRYFDKKTKSVAADSNYSAQLDESGMIKDIKAGDYVTLPEYNNLKVSLSDIEYADEDVESDIEDILEEHEYLDDTEGLAAADGDTVNIDHVGKVDGVEFEGGTDIGHELELGSGTFIDDFEDQIVGHTVGETFDVEVTFPEDYSNDETLAGKDAVFTVTLNGIYKTPEFTDEFVAENLSEYASTADEYRQYIKNINQKDNLREYVNEYIVANTTINSYPSAYLKQLKANYKAGEISYYEYMSSMYSNYYGYTQYSSFDDYLSQVYSMTEAEYDESLDEKVTDGLKAALFCQAVAEKEGITATLDEAREHYIAEGGTEEDFTSQTTTYGTGYAVQQMLQEKVIEMICDGAIIE